MNTFEQRPGKGPGRDRDTVRARIDQPVRGPGRAVDPAIVLAESARRLAGEGKTAKTGEPRRSVVAFGLAREIYAIDLAWVREVNHKMPVTPMPFCPEHFAGAASIHGRVVAVIDLKRFLDLPGVGLSDKILVVSGAGAEFAILVDTIEGVETFPQAQLRAVPAGLAGIRREFFAGLTDNGRILIEGSRLLGDPALRLEPHDPGGAPGSGGTQP